MQPLNNLSGGEKEDLRLWWNKIKNKTGCVNVILIGTREIHGLEYSVYRGIVRLMTWKFWDR